MCQEMLPCPFCGLPGETWEDTSGNKPDKRYGCRDCQVSMYDVSEWNRRSTRWIPVSERLPEDSKNKLPHDAIEVLAHNERGTYTAILYYGTFCGDNKLENITHWMPLPSFPKGMEK